MGRRYLDEEGGGGGAAIVDAELSLLGDLLEEGVPRDLFGARAPQRDLRRQWRRSKWSFLPKKAELKEK